MSTIADDGSEFSSASVNDLIFYLCFDICSIVTEVGYLGSAADVHMIPDDRVPEVGEMRNRRVFSDV